MNGRKYDYDQVRGQVELYLLGGGEKKWSAAAKALDIPPTSLKGIMEYEWPDVGESLVEGVVDQRIVEIIAALKSGPKTLTELANELNIGPATVEGIVQAMAESSQYDIDIGQRKIAIPTKPPSPTHLNTIWPPGEIELILAHASDFHFGSIYHQNTALRHFAKYVADQGCRHCLVSGDITAGNFGERDVQEIYAYGADEQVEAACDGIPEIEGLTWLLQGGNHDYTHYKRDGVNVVRHICDQRADCTYVGYVKSDVPLLSDRKVRLWHPSGGKPYARSYRGQKGAEVAAYEWLNEAVSDDEVSQIVMLQWGHTHYRDLFWYGPMMVFNPGCFQAEYAWLAQKAMSPEIAGLITKTTMSSSGWGSIADFRWLSYRAAQDDYRPIKHKNVLEFEEIEPLFTLHPAST